MVFRNLTVISRRLMSYCNYEFYLLNEFVKRPKSYRMRLSGSLPSNRFAGTTSEPITSRKRRTWHAKNQSHWRGILPQTSSITVNEITKNIHFYRHTSNNFKETTYVDVDAPYGPPLTILLPWLFCEASDIQKFVELYGSRGFDVITVRLDKNQMLYPMEDDGAIRIVSNFLEYLHNTHRYRPYLVHGLSIGAYVYGEMVAQLTEQFESFSTLVGNIKGCLWDSPVDYMIPAPIAGKILYPRNFVKRCLFERAVARHFADHRRDSIDCWERSRAYFCHQKCKVPNLFFVSEKDPLSNPSIIDPIRNLMEKNGIPTYQKIWQDTGHLEHFTKHFDEYMYGMELFFSLANMFADPSGKFNSYNSNAHLTSIRLRKKAGEIS